MKKINKIALAIFLIIIFIGIILIGYIENNKEKLYTIFPFMEEVTNNNLSSGTIYNVFDEIYRGEINSSPY